ncbi:uncharacterized protein LOC119793860 isoform X3 [Cyprinodon tularosa]|uniref:uncharacterized protein LOC119793860 isoform X3 n=1 Tax=Cyprinodon tularosa TaxID=77115 RepID=UPI0018E25FFE|nr:uncharacterized protein LOC119793860 isoform X3 [Cyprinodon tularosa]
MCSVQLQGEFISEQLTPAEETLTEVKGREKRPKVEMDDQHRLLDFTRIPQSILHRIDRLQDYVGKKEVSSDEQFSEQERNSVRIPVFCVRLFVLSFGDSAVGCRSLP